jgi:pimeloyl-ACP methyl ester carboxylesterase
MLTDFAISASTGEPVRGIVQAKFDNCLPDLVRGDLSACNEFDVMEKLGEIAVPTWIIVGEDDRLTPVKYSSFLSSRIEGSRLVRVPAAGHLVMMEKPEQFNRHLREFLIGLKK